VVKISLPYGTDFLEAMIPKEAFLFEAKMKEVESLSDFVGTLVERLDHPIGCKPLKEMVKKEDKVLILVEDNTRNTPVKDILPVLIDYLLKNGLKEEQVEILIAPGTHRVMTKEEVREKVGKDIQKRINISQHDINDEGVLVDLGSAQVKDMIFPVSVNKKVLEADFLIGLGNIVPHCDAGFSGGAKIVQPGVCGYATTAATHMAGAFLEEIPLGDVENPCRIGIEEVGRKVGLNFIINVVMTPDDKVVNIFAGDFVLAHREGAKAAAKVYGVEIPQPADIVIVSSNPFDIDYWQAEKGLVTAYFSVKKGGQIIFVSPCYEGLVNNHPRLLDWAKLSSKELVELVKKTPLDDEKADLIAADVALGGIRAREKATILAVTDGLTNNELMSLGYQRVNSLQKAVDQALDRMPEGKIGILPRGGDCLPLLISAK